jgi:hypothetical protein
MSFVVSACFYYGKVEASREQQEEDQRKWDTAMAVGCFCVSGARLQQSGERLPEEPL